MGRGLRGLMEIHRLVVGLFQMNAQILKCPDTGEGIVIDPGDEPERLLAAVEEHDVDVQCLVGTHGHVDHVGAAMEVRAALGVPFLFHGEDVPLLDLVPRQAEMFGLGERHVPEVDQVLAHGDRVEFGRCALDFLHTPGHSPGSVCLADGVRVFSGDVLFAGSIGRTDLWGGSMDVLMDSIRDRLLVMEDQVAVHPGHGPDTSIGAERAGNPFLVGLTPPG